MTYAAASTSHIHVIQRRPQLSIKCKFHNETVAVSILTTCRLTGGYQRSEGTRRQHLQGLRIRANTAERCEMD